jgi:hypothetical protein
MRRGDLAEAKGPGFEWLMAAGGDKRTKTLDDFANQAERQLRTAGAAGRGLKWYFADPYVADQVRAEFAGSDLEKIVITTMPPRSRK